MFKTIVMATDLSPAWNEIVACAGEFKALGCSEIILTHVISVLFMVGWKVACGSRPGRNWKPKRPNWRLKGSPWASRYPPACPPIP